MDSYPSSVISAQEESNALRHRTLAQETQVIAEQASPGYYIVEVDSPVAEEIYRKIAGKQQSKDFFQKFYVIKADAQILKQLQNEHLIYNMWRYTHPENYDHAISADSRQVRVSF